MTDPNNSNPTTDPQDLIDQALTGVTTPATLPTPEPLTPATPPPPMADDAIPPATPPVDMPITPVEETVPTELNQPMETPAPLTPDLPPEPPKAPAVGDDMPLAFAETTAPTATAPVIEPVAPFVPPALTSSPTDNVMPKKKKSIPKIMVAIVGFFALLSGIGWGSYYYYTDYYGEAGTIAAVDAVGEHDCNAKSCEDGQAYKWKNGQCVWVNKPCDGGGPAPTSGNQSECTGCKNGYKVRWNATQGVCIQDGLCNLGEFNGAASCQGAGGFWCRVVDSSGKEHEFCGDNAGRACYTQAIEDHGITMQIGKVGCECIGNGSDGKCNTWSLDDATLAAINGAQTLQATKDMEIARVSAQCQNQGGSFSTQATESYICKIGVKGYTGGSCTATNGSRFYGQLGCFCGTVQVDTSSGHTSYSSTCGCDKPEEQPSPSPSPSPSASSSLMCVGITKTPNKTPAIGDTFTFTCQGSSVPAGSINLSYKFRYSLNSGAYVTMNNATATTADLVIAACGSYKVQCQTCGTINGAIVCDPDWTAATGN